MPRRLFTPAVIEAIREMAKQRKTAAAIAATIGSTPGSVCVKCCHLKIPLSRRGRPGLVPDPFDKEKLVVYMPRADFDALREQASHMRKPAGELAGMLLQAIVSSNIYKAVLDQDP